VGETTGNLEENLAYLAEFYEGEVNESVGNLTTVIEPLLLLFMGFLVGFVALSIITPIYKITQGLQI
jgi:type IV pilus assembly protein PilC